MREAAGIRSSLCRMRSFPGYCTGKSLPADEAFERILEKLAEAIYSVTDCNRQSS